MRRIAYVTGTRADFGLMRQTLDAIARSGQFELGLLVTGMHLSAQYGSTVSEIEATGLPVVARVPLPVEGDSGAAMARAIAIALGAFVEVFESWRPDVVLLLGDRGEMLAAAIAAIHLNIPIVHLHGGERSGTVDEPVRHAISKLAHFHFVATEESRGRLIRMGEMEHNIHVVGAPGLDGLRELASRSREELCRETHFDPSRPIALWVFHPVMQLAERSSREAQVLLDAVMASNLQTIAVLPNADAGNRAIREELLKRAEMGRLAVFSHLAREVFVSWMAAADLMIGNSSAGIIEAASFGTPVVNVGTRQSMRERNSNVFDCEVDADRLVKAIGSALEHGRFSGDNLYGDGQATRRICALLAEVGLDGRVLFKLNAY